MNEYRYSDHNLTDSREVALVHPSNRHMRLDAFEVFEFSRNRRVNVWRWFLGGAVTILLGLSALIAVAGAGR